MLKDSAAPIQQVHTPADTVAQRSARFSGSLLLAVVILLGVTKLLDMAFLNPPVTPNEEATTLSVSNSLPDTDHAKSLAPTASSNPLWQVAFYLPALVVGMELIMLTSSSCSKYLLE